GLFQSQSGLVLLGNDSKQALAFVGLDHHRGIVGPNGKIWFENTGQQLLSGKSPGAVQGRPEAIGCELAPRGRMAISASLKKNRPPTIGRTTLSERWLELFH